MIYLKKCEESCEESKPMSYDEVVKLIWESEVRVNEALRTIKLQSSEKQPAQQRQPMSKEKLEMILECVWKIVALLVGFAIMLAYLYCMTH